MDGGEIVNGMRFHVDLGRHSVEVEGVASFVEETVNLHEFLTSRLTTKDAGLYSLGSQRRCRETENERGFDRRS